MELWELEKKWSDLSVRRSSDISSHLRIICSSIRPQPWWRRVSSESLSMAKFWLRSVEFLLFHLGMLRIDVYVHIYADVCISIFRHSNRQILCELTIIQITIIILFIKLPNTMSLKRWGLILCIILMNRRCYNTSYVVIFRKRRNMYYLIRWHLLYNIML